MGYSRALTCMHGCIVDWEEDRDGRRKGKPDMLWLAVRLCGDVMGYLHANRSYWHCDLAVTHIKLNIKPERPHYSTDNLCQLG